MTNFNRQPSYSDSNKLISLDSAEQTLLHSPPPAVAVEITKSRLVERKNPERFVLPIVVLCLLIAGLIVSLINLNGAHTREIQRYTEAQTQLTQQYYAAVKRADTNLTHLQSENNRALSAQYSAQIYADAVLANELLKYIDGIKYHNAQTTQTLKKANNLFVETNLPLVSAHYIN